MKRLRTIGCAIAAVAGVVACAAAPTVAAAPQAEAVDGAGYWHAAACTAG